VSQPPPLRVLVDAQLPKRLAHFLAFHAGYDCLHTLDLPAANSTQDGAITRLSMAEERIVITKDADFVNSFLLYGQPYKLLLVSTGNISTTDLLELFRQFLPQLTKVFAHHSYVELSRTLLVTHR
jgi:predicted nuclease of predicted toxin-antitoxin system